MADRARKQTDKILSNMENHIDKLYNEAYSGISKSWDAFMSSHKAKLDDAKAKLEEAGATVELK